MGRLWWVSAGRGEGGVSLTGGTGGGGRKVPEGACERAEGAGHGGKVGKWGRRWRAQCQNGRSHPRDISTNLSVCGYVTRCTRYIQTHPSGYLVSTGSGLLPLRPATACTSRRMAQ